MSSFIRIPVYKGNNIRKDKKILIVGESYYSEKEKYLDDKEKTLQSFPKIVMDHYLNENNEEFWNIKYFSKITKFLEDVNLIKNDLNEVYYYNYVQRILSAKRINNKRQFEKANWNDDILGARNAFFELLKEINPDIIIFFSATCYDASTYYKGDVALEIIHNDKHICEKFNDSEKRNYCARLSYFCVDGKDVPVFRFPHLTGGPCGWSFNKNYMKLEKMIKVIDKYAMK